MRKRRFLRMKKFVKYVLPRSVNLRFNKVKQLAFSVNLIARRRDRLERKKYEEHQAYPIPPLPLRKRIGAGSIEDFLNSGEHCFDDIQNALKKQGEDLNDFNALLDFGCGCGRTLRWFDELKDDRTIVGVDVDDELVDWSKTNIPFAPVYKSNYLPPLPFESESFDLIYSISVFSHLEESIHLQWLDELRRVLKKGGYALISILGSYCYEPYVQGFHFEGLPVGQPIPEYVHGDNELDKVGFVFIPHDIKSGYGLTFISTGYVSENWRNYLDVVDVIHVGMDRLQDVVLLRKR